MINFKGHLRISSITGVAIKSRVDSYMEIGARVIIFAPNSCNHGFAAYITKDKFDKEKETKKANLFLMIRNPD